MLDACQHVSAGDYHTINLATLAYRHGLQGADLIWVTHATELTVSMPADLNCVTFIAQSLVACRAGASVPSLARFAT